MIQERFPAFARRAFADVRWDRDRRLTELRCQAESLFNAQAAAWALRTWSNH
jgi:hypothetical protein